MPYLLFLLVMPVLGLIYKYLNDNPGESVVLATKIDKFIPFLPVFILPYIIWYAFILGYLIYFWYKDVRVYLNTLSVVVLGELVCFIIYLYFQTTVPRPVLSGEGVLIDLVRMIYSHDQPYNAFPSIHVLTTFAIVLGYINIKNKDVFHSFFVPVMGSLIIVSTLFVKQHYVLDVVGSVFLTSFFHVMVFGLYESKYNERSASLYLK